MSTDNTNRILHNFYNNIFYLYNSKIIWLFFLWMFELNSTAQVTGWLTESYWTWDGLRLNETEPVTKIWRHIGILLLICFGRFGGLTSQIFHICAATWSSAEKKTRHLRKLVMANFPLRCKLHKLWQSYLMAYRYVEMYIKTVSCFGPHFHNWNYSWSWIVIYDKV